MRRASRRRLFKLAASAAGSTIVITASADRDIPCSSHCVPSLRSESHIFTVPDSTSGDEQLAFVRDLFMVTALSSWHGSGVGGAGGCQVQCSLTTTRRGLSSFGVVDLLTQCRRRFFGCGDLCAGALARRREVSQSQAGCSCLTGSVVGGTAARFSRASCCR